MNSARNGVELLSPTTGKEKDRLGLEECEFDEHSRLSKCPCGKKTIKKTFDGQKGRAVFAGKTCGKCPKFKQCIASKNGQNYVIAYDSRTLRLRKRRLHEQTDEFHERYRMRSGIEALFGNLKQNPPLRRVGFRGKEAVFNAIYAILTVHNIMQMARYYASIPRKSGTSPMISLIRTLTYLTFPPLKPVSAMRSLVPHFFHAA